MPVVVDEVQWEYWLDPGSNSVEGLLAPWDGEMACHRVTQEDERREVQGEGRGRAD